MSGILDIWWHAMSCKGTDSPAEGFAGYRPHGLSPGLPLLTDCGFPWQAVHIPGSVTASLTSSLQLLLLGTACKVHDPVTHFLPSLGFPLKTHRSIYDPINLAFCMSEYKTSIRWVVSKVTHFKLLPVQKVASLPQATVIASCVPKWLTTESTSV